MGEIWDGLRATCGAHCKALLLLSLVAALFLSGCAMPYGHPCLRPPDAAFPGISDAFTAADGQSVPEIDLLLIHGMGTTTYQWVADRVGALAPALGFHWDGTPIPSTPLKNGALLYTLALQDGARRLDISAVLWNPVTEDAKKTLCFDVTKATPLCTDSIVFSKDTRAFGNALLKNQLMDDRLADVTFYLGPDGGGRIREAIQDGLLRSLSTNMTSLADVLSGEAPNPKATPVFLLSESLGSKIVVDSLETLEAIPNAKEFAQIERSHIDSLFLLANQIPILGLGESTEPGEVGSTNVALKKFIRKRAARRIQDGNSGKPLRIVAFSDPNDVFSYQLSQGMFSGESVVISNVVISNDKTYAGFIENPITAHTGYIGRGITVRAIATGSAALPDPHSPQCGG
jgi:hypothetical protein